jgi:Zn-dependent protease with chaperone function
VAVALAALVVVMRATALDLPPVGRLAAACRTWLFPDLTAVQLLVLVLGVLGVTVITRAGASAVRTYRVARAGMRGLRSSRALAGRPRARVIENAAPMAFCAGLLRPRTYISTGALDKLDDRELQAVLAHEAHHAERRDPLRLFVAQVLADALFFLPIMRHLRRRYAT